MNPVQVHDTTDTNGLSQQSNQSSLPAPLHTNEEAQNLKQICLNGIMNELNEMCNERQLQIFAKLSHQQQFKQEFINGINNVINESNNNNNNNQLK